MPQLFVYKCGLGIKEPTNIDMPLNKETKLISFLLCYFLIDLVVLSKSLMLLFLGFCDLSLLESFCWTLSSRLTCTHIIIIIITFFESFSYQSYLMVFNWSLRNSKSPQVCGSFLSILTNLNNASSLVILM